MTDADDEFEPSAEELREAEALARALEGEAEPAEAPADAAAMAAFLRANASAESIGRRAAKVEREVFGQAPPRSNVRRFPFRGLGYATTVLASAATLLVLIRTGSLGFGPAGGPVATAPSAETAPAAPTAAAPDVAAPCGAPPPSVLDADRALLEAPPEARDAALTALRGALARDRDETLAALVVAHGGSR